MFVVDRTRVGTDEIPGEKVDIVGTTGNIYTITIGKAPSCSCPDARKGNQCKHIIYVCYTFIIYSLPYATRCCLFLLEPKKPNETN